MATSRGNGMKLMIRNSGHYLNRTVMFTAMSMMLVFSSLSLAQPAVADESSNMPTEQVGIPAEDNQPREGSAEALNHWLDDKLSRINGVLAQVLFWDVTFGQLKSLVPDAQGQPVLQGPEIPFVIAFLVFGAVFFTFWHGLINIRAFKHAIDVVRGKFDRPEDVGEITHFRALTSALSATVGLGNIAGVAIAVRMGGPGAVFWMMILAVFGMTAKFHECTLAQMFRRRNADGSISGGPMFYLHEGLRQVHPLLGGLGKFLAILFAVMCIGGALGGGNMFQANQSFEAFASAFKISGESRALVSQGFGIIMAGLVAAVIIGGIKRIGAATSRIVPSMCGLYVLASVIIIAVNFREIPNVIVLIFNSAFNPDAALGGVIAVMIIGFQRAAFSNEAGLGSAAIAHAAAKTEEPVREGIVSLLGPFIDTIVICAMTAMVVIITGAYKDAPANVSGSAVTMHAFQELPGIGEWFPYILSICIILFAFSTMISWCYYGERAWDSLFGNRSVIIFRILFVVAVFIGAVIPLKAVLNFSDLMILCMAFPNILGGLILAPMVKEKAKDYWTRYKSGQMKPTSNA
tara:strand:- start:6632 stop:8356 length:1725 start_codon:yes stop_codon:yes gene_type:complete